LSRWHWFLWGAAFSSASVAVSIFSHPLVIFFSWRGGSKQTTELLLPSEARGLAEWGGSFSADTVMDAWESIPLKMNHSKMHKENPFGLNRQIMFLTGPLLHVNLL
jgi:hypothetical protein